jgi:phosphopantetheine adenylyltransferase
MTLPYQSAQDLVVDVKNRNLFRLVLSGARPKSNIIYLQSGAKLNISISQNLTNVYLLSNN